jgi:hypothetical protein
MSEYVNPKELEKVKKELENLKRIYPSAYQKLVEIIENNQSVDYETIGRLIAEEIDDRR